MSILWDSEESISEFGFKQPEWITEDLDCSQVMAIIEGGCDSGSYMPACIYGQALTTMDDHGDDVLEYIDDTLGELPSPPKDSGWSQLACFYLSYAVELYCSSIQEELENALEEAREAEGEGGKEILKRSPLIWDY